MDRASRTGCYHTIVGNFHDLSSRPQIIIEPIRRCRPKGIDPDLMAVETVELERRVQAGIDEINEARRKKDWLGSHYVWNSREQAWTRRPSYKELALMTQKIIEDEGAHLRQVKSDNPINKRAATRPHPLRRARTHEHPLHHHRGHRDGHRDGHGLYHPTHAQAKHARGHPTQAHNYHALHNYHREDQDKHGMESQQHPHPHHHRDDKQGVDQPEWVLTRTPDEDQFVDVFSEMFSDDEDKPAHHMGPRQSYQHKPVEYRQPGQRPILARVYSSKGKLARRHAPPLPHPQRPALHRTETYLENLPKRDTQQTTYRHPKKFIEKLAKGLPPPHPHHKEDRGKGGLHTNTTHHQKRWEEKAGEGKQSHSHASAQGDQKTLHHEPTPIANLHVEGMQILNPSNRPSIGGGAKTTVPGRSTFIIGPDDHSNPREASMARKSVENEANHAKPLSPQQLHAFSRPPSRPITVNPRQPSAMDQDEDDDDIDIKERLRRAIIAEGNENAVQSDYEDYDNDEGPPRPQPPAQQQQRQQVVSCPSTQSRTDRPQQPKAASLDGGLVGVKEQLRRVVMAEDNQDAVFSDEDEESEVDNDQASKAPPPQAPRQHQKMAPVLSSQSKDRKQEAVRERLLHAIGTRGHKMEGAIQKEEEAPVDTRQATPPSCASGGSKPGSLLTQSIMAQRAAAAVDDVDSNAPSCFPEQHNRQQQQEEEQQHEQQDDSQHPFGPKEALLVTVELCKREVERWGIQCITRAVFDDDVPEQLRLQNKANRKSQLGMAQLIENGRRTGVKIQRIGDKDVRDKAAARERRKKEKPDYVLDYRYNHIREEPMPNCGARFIW